MLLIAVYCMFAATVVLAGASCFLKKNSHLYFLLKALSTVSLICLILTVTNYKNFYNGFTILLTLSLCPHILSLFDLKSYLQSKKEKTAEIPSTELGEKTDNENPKKKIKTLFVESNGMLLQSVDFLLTSICISFCCMYFGQETAYGFLIGLALGFAGFFLAMIIKKNINLFDGLGILLATLSIGLVLGQIITIFMAGIDLISIIFSVGALGYCIYVALSLKFRQDLKFDFVHLTYCVSAILMILTVFLI